MILTKFTTYQSCIIKCLKPWPAGKSNRPVNGEGGIRKHRAVSTVLPVFFSSVPHLTYLLNIQQAKHPIKNYTTAYTPGAITVRRRRPNGGLRGRNLISHRRGKNHDHQALYSPSRTNYHHDQSDVKCHQNT